MALKNSDLFAVYRESDTTAYHLKASNLQFKLPDGDDANQMLVFEALKRSNGNKSIAARMLGITRQTIIKNSK